MVPSRLVLACDGRHTGCWWAHLSDRAGRARVSLSIESDTLPSRHRQPYYREAVTEIDTPRLHLRPLTKDDQPLFVELFVLVLNVPEEGCAKALTSQRRVAPKPIRRVLQQPEHDEELVVKHLEPMQSYRPAQSTRRVARASPSP